MTRSITLAALVVLAAGCACASEAAVPAALQPAGEQQAMTISARGAQVYECRACKAGCFEWVFVAPDAELLDGSERVIGHHGAGPTWQSIDGSRIVGAVKARAEAPMAGAVPWLLLTTKSTGSAGAFSGVTSIQRVNTTGGVAPSAPCGAETNGSVLRVPYTADYIFFTAG